MAYANTSFGYSQTQPDSTMERKRAAFVDDDDSAVLDPSILDADIMSSPRHNSNPFRKDSFANSNGILSPPDSQPWEHHYGSGLSVEPTSAGSSSIFQDDGSAFTAHSNQAPPSSFAQQQQQHVPPPPWSFEHGSEQCTPTTGVDFMPPPPPFDTNYQRNDSAHGSFSQPPPPPPPPQHFGVGHADSTFIPVPTGQTPMSPHSHRDWMGMAQQEMEGRSGLKRMRPDSPPRAIVDFQRRDGIRKKNGRIDIPQERNIQTIDELIENTNDEDLLKELKQQKRLLRNREAALASRQRKKKHTEDLEVKEKNYTNQITMLETKLNELTIEREHRERERQLVHQRLSEAQRIIETMHDEKRDLIMRHNEETSSLRKKVQVLTDHLEAGPAPAMSTVPSSNGFTDFNAEMEALNMGPHDWDNFILVNELQSDSHHDDFTFDPKPEPIKPSNTLAKKSSASTIVPASDRRPESVTDQPFASGLLFMLLLCGAFVASRPVDSQSPDLPNMPADVRAAAPTVLSNLLSEAGPDSSIEQGHPVTRIGQEPVPSCLPYNSGSPSELSRLDRMHRTITSPSKQQQIDQAFSLTAAQYASLTDLDFPTYNEPQPSSHQDEPPRRNLANALANLEQERRNSKAEVYTRSLLWDQIPADVVRQFKEMVRDHDEIERRQQQQRQSHDYAYKIEQ